MKKYKYFKVEKANDKQFKEIMEVENATESGYEEETMKEIWITGNKNDNFICEYDGKIVAHISFNPNSKRRNGSIYMVNLTVLPSHRKQGIAQNLIYTACKYFLGLEESKCMSLSVDKDNIPAINLYKKVGYEIKEPICEADEDDEQYVMDSTLQNIKKTIEGFSKTKEEKQL